MNDDGPATVIGAVAILLATVGFILVYNAIIRRKNAVIRAWSDVVAYQRQKIKLLPELEQKSREFLTHERELMLGVTELRSAVARMSPDTIDVEALADVGRRTARLLAGFRAVSERYPDLRSADVVRDMIAEMIELEDNIAAALTIFNRNVAIFNSGVETFPNSLVNALSARLPPYPAFTDSGAESAIEYKFRA